VAEKVIEADALVAPVAAPAAAEAAGAGSATAGAAAGVSLFTGALIIVGVIVVLGATYYAVKLASEAQDLGEYGGTLPPGGVPAPTTPVPAPAPQAGPRTRHPNQTCDDDVYDQLRNAVLDCKTFSFSCSDDVERRALGITTRKAFEKLPDSAKWPCPEILGRLADAEKCAKARKDFQDQCFQGTSDDGHPQQVKDWEAAADECFRKAQARGCL
jgi:hypothetical protein